MRHESQSAKATDPVKATPPALRLVARDENLWRSQASTADTEDGTPVVGGINQSLVLLGKTFHAQSELYGDAIRTEIFLGGRIVATRETQLDRDALNSGTDSLRASLVSWHKKVVSGLLARATSRHDQQSSPAASLQVQQSQAEPSDSATPAHPRRAELGSSDALELSRRVRRLFEQFREKLGTTGNPSDRTFRARLEQAGHAFAWIRRSPDFLHARIDEQVRIHILQQEIGDWLADGQDAVQAAQLWSAIETFSRNTTGINKRADLVAFDRQSRERAEAAPRPEQEQEQEQEQQGLARVDLESLSSIDGFLGICLVDSSNGTMLSAAASSSVDLQIAAAGNAEVVRAKRKTIAALELDDNIEDILISLGSQYHLIRLLRSANALFLFLVLDRDQANLAMARHSLKSFESTLDLR